MRFRRAATLVLSLPLATSLAQAQPSGSAAPDQRTSAVLESPDLRTLSIEQLLEVEVVAPTKAPQPVREAPSIVSVITRDEIRLWGFNSVAEALVLVPGVYCVDDYVAPDCGVRGI